MIREDHDNVRFFYGREVEHTPMFGQPTLFIVGLQTKEDIRRALASSTYETHHLYFGANQSFPDLGYNDAKEWSDWEDMIMPFLEDGLWCTLDLDVKAVPGLTDGGLCEQDRFIPMISVKIPYARTLGYNAVIKIDDIDFGHSNPGVWCHSLHDLQNRDCFTDWSRYSKDQVIG